MERNLYESDPIRHPYAAAGTLIFTIALMTCIFATLDNAVIVGMQVEVWISDSGQD